jgi:hypothetical protein
LSNSESVDAKSPPIVNSYSWNSLNAISFGCCTSTVALTKDFSRMSESVPVAAVLKYRSKCPVVGLCPANNTFIPVAGTARATGFVICFVADEPFAGSVVH